jgi:predicted dehydrogenase/threonine dehydrogenase-like Zn-dependent dehydrogenase
MKQVIQDFKDGELSVHEVPPPSLSPGFVLVRNHFSLISAGTERSSVSTAKASLLGKARQRPDLVRQVIQTFKREGFAETLMRVRTKLETLKELGYSSAGTVIASMDTNGLFKPGDRVACGGGGYASHAGVVAVPQNLVVKVPERVSLDHAAFTTLGSIALQGVRQANPRLGEFVCVIGLGLLGQLTAQILRANGCQVFGIDMSPAMVKFGEQTSCHRALLRNDPNLDSELDFFTNGRGFDSVIITAAAQSSDPVELATAILRQKGAIVIVGSVPMNIPREPHFYKKELELRISCSYGPGRYDTSYEEDGNDYPYGYVRWTENRNMGAFVRLLENKSIDVKSLITHVIDIEEAERAYDIVTGAVKERSIAILLKYPEIEEPQRTTPSGAAVKAETKIQIGFIGAGSFAQKYLIPRAALAGTLNAVVTSRGVTAKNAGEKFGFAAFSTDTKDVLANENINVVFIATRHDTHADLVISSLEEGKHVFVEKPLALRESDLKRIAEVVERAKECKLIVGFNRRFAPLALEARQVFQNLSEPLVVNYRVNAGFIPKDHWIQREQGGGRILGEVCHFIDFIQFITRANPIKLTAEAIGGASTKMDPRDNVAITLGFDNGSVGIITYVANGDKLLNKERIEIFGGGKTVVIDDFRSAEIYSGGRCKRLKLAGKGHSEEVDLFIRSVREGLPSPISFESLHYTTLTTFRILDALHTGLPQSVVIK